MTTEILLPNPLREKRIKAEYRLALNRTGSETGDNIGVEASLNDGRHLHKSPLTIALLVCLLLILIYCLKKLRQYYLNQTRKSNIKRYFDFGGNPSVAEHGYSGVAGDEFDELLVGVFENDDFTQFDDENDDSDESIGSILSEWSDKNFQGDNINRAKRKSTHTELIELGQHGTTFEIVPAVMDQSKAASPN